MSETEAKTDAPTAEEIKGTKRSAEVSRISILIVVAIEMLRIFQKLTRKK